MILIKWISYLLFGLTFSFLLGEAIPAEDITISDCIRGSGNVKEEIRSLPFFKDVDIDGVFDVSIVCQEKQNVRVSGDDNILPAISTKVEGEKLLIRTDVPICTTSELSVHISVSNIERVKVSGAINLAITKVQNQKLSIDHDGAGDIEASGKTKSLEITIDGSGDLNAKDLVAENVKVKLDGASDVVVHAVEKLEVDHNGAGDIQYKGKPKTILLKGEGIGDLEPLHVP